MGALGAGRGRGRHASRRRRSTSSRSSRPRSSARVGECEVTLRAERVPPRDLGGDGRATRAAAARSRRRSQGRVQSSHLQHLLAEDWERAARPAAARRSGARARATRAARASTSRRSGSRSRTRSTSEPALLLRWRGCVAERGRRRRAGDPWVGGELPEPARGARVAGRRGAEAARPERDPASATRISPTCWSAPTRRSRRLKRERGRVVGRELAAGSPDRARSATSRARQAPARAARARSPRACSRAPRAAPRPLRAAARRARGSRLRERDAEQLERPRHVLAVAHRAARARCSRAAARRRRSARRSCSATAPSAASERAAP